MRGGGGVAGSSKWAQLYTGAQINFEDLSQYLTYVHTVHFERNNVFIFCFHSSGLRKVWRPARVRLGWPPCWVRARLVGGGAAADQEKVMIKGGLQRDVVYFSWPIAPSYTSPNARGGGGSCGVSAQLMNTVVHITWHGAQINEWVKFPGKIKRGVLSSQMITSHDNTRWYH